MAPPSGRYSTLNAYGLCMGYIWPISTPNIHQMAAHNQITCLLLDIPFISNRNTLRSTLKPAVKDTPHVLLNDRYFWVICCSTRRSCLLASIRACLLASCVFFGSVCLVHRPTSPSCRSKPQIHIPAAVRLSSHSLLLPLTVHLSSDIFGFITFILRA